MTTAKAQHRRRLPRLVALAGLLVVAAGLLGMSEQARTAADFILSLHLPGTPGPDASVAHALALTTTVVAAVAMVIAALLLWRSSGAVFAVAGAWSALAAIVTLFALATVSDLIAVRIGPVVLSPIGSAVIVLAGAVVAMGAAVIGWFGAPRSTEVSRPVYMPPPTHHG